MEIQEETYDIDAKMQVPANSICLILGTVEWSPLTTHPFPMPNEKWVPFRKKVIILAFMEITV